MTDQIPPEPGYPPEAGYPPEPGYAPPTAPPPTAPPRPAVAPAPDYLRVEAMKRLKAKRELQAHVLAFVLVNSFLVIIWAVSGAGFFWPVFPIFGWGIGLVFNIWNVYSPEPSEDRIQAEIRKLRDR
jgi:hypothetical protein